MSLAVTEVKQSRRLNTNNQPLPLPSLSPSMAPGGSNLTAASVHVGHVVGGAVVEEEEQHGKRKAKVRKQKTPRPKTHHRSPTHQRRVKRQAREERQVRQAKESLTVSALDHDSSPVLVMKGSVDGRVCNDVLVDPGATSNFVRRSWVQSQRLREQTLRVPLQVKLAVGEVPIRQLGGVAVKSAEVSGSSAPCVLVVMEHLSHQVILGMPWLRRAGVDLGIRDAMTWNGRKLHIHPSGRVTAQLKAVTVKVDSTYKELMTKPDSETELECDSVQGYAQEP